MQKKTIKTKKADPLSSKDNITLKEFEQRKNRIEAELNQIRYNLDRSFDKAKSSVIKSIIPSGSIRSNPLKSVGIAVVAGFVLGLAKGRKKNSGENETVRFRKPGISYLIFDELRRMAARRASLYFMDLVDAKISRYKDESIKE